MTENDASRQIRSFLSLAFAQKPTLTIAGPLDAEGKLDNAIRVSLNTQRTVSEQELRPLEQLMEKYESIKQYLDITSFEQIQISDPTPTIKFEPNLSYCVLTITPEQLETAKEVARHIERINSSYRANNLEQAKLEYNAYHEFLTEKRTTLLGDFKDVASFDDVVALRGVGGMPDVVECPALIGFIIIEIYIG